MIKKLLLFTLLVLNLGSIVSYAQEGKSYYVISSGSPGGNYYKTGAIISELLGKMDESSIFISVPSTGSIDNVNKIKKRFADFALVQQDVLLNNFYGDNERIKNITLILPLFQEKFIIYTHYDSPISFEKFREVSQKRDRTKIKIGVTSKKGTTYDTFLSISGLLGLDLNSISFVVEDYSVLIEKFKSGEIDYFITFSLPIEEIEERKQASIVYFSHEQILLLKSKIRQLSESKFSNDQHKTLGVWSFLIGLDSSIKWIGEEKVIKSLMKVYERDDLISKEIQNTLTQFKEYDHWHDDHLSNVPVSQYLLKELGYKTNYIDRYYIQFVFFVVVVCFTLWAFYSFNKSDFVHRIGRIYVRTRYKYIFLEVIVFVSLYLIFIQVLIYFENRLFIETAIKNEILDMGYKDIHFWNFVRIFTGNDGGIFPLSSMGKIMVSASAYTIWIGGLIIIFVEYFNYQLNIKRRKGLVKLTYNDHLIIAGWNESTPNVIRELLLACNSFNNKKITIVCIAKDPESIINNNDYINSLVQKKVISFVSGYIRQKKTLEQSNANLAKTIILLSDDDTIQSDERTLLRALSISKFCKKKCSTTGKTANSVYVIAQVNNSEFIEDFTNAGVNGIINKNIADGILVQSILNPGVSKLMNNIFSYSNDTNEFYAIDLSRSGNSSLRNKTFDELLLPLREQGILLVAIRVIYRDESNNIIVDEDEINARLEKEGLYRQIITNPITKAEISRNTTSDDQLLVLAVSAMKLERGIENINI